MQQIIEQYINDFNSTIDLGQFLLNFLIVCLISFIIKIFYINYGQAVSDREKFSGNFVPLALATMLIITVIKSSIALSLGLVGALSIVRFRAAIKDPEELTYLFLIIGLGLIGGANKPILAVLSFGLILPLLYINNRVSSKKRFSANKASLHISTNLSDSAQLSQQIGTHCDFLELKRMDIDANGRNVMNFQCKLNSTTNLDSLISNIKEMDTSATISFIDNQDLLL